MNKQIITTQVASIFIFLFMFLTQLNAQVPYFNKLWEKQYGGSARDGTNSKKSIIQYSDSIYYILCGSRSNLGGNKTDENCTFDSAVNADAWLIKIDFEGNKLWDHTYGGSDDDGCKHIFVDDSGYIVLSGGSWSNASCEKSQNSFDASSDSWIIKTDTAGNKIWDKRFGGNGVDGVFGGAYSAENNSYLFCNYSTSYLNGNVTDTLHAFADFWLFKIGSNGAKQWDNMIGSFGDDLVYTFCSDDNKEYFICGSTTGNGPSGDLVMPHIGGLHDGWVVKIDTSGQIVWQHLYGGMDDEAIVYAVEEDNGNNVLLGYLDINSIGGDISDSVCRGSIDIWILRVDSTGNKISDKRIGGNNNDSPTSLLKTPDGGFLIMSTSKSDAGFEKSANAIGGSDFWLIKLDSLFNIQWDKTIGGPDNEWEPTVLFLNDSTFLLSGQSDSDMGGDKGINSFDTITNPIYTKSDMWLTKWMMTSAPLSVSEIENAGFSMYPNPATNNLQVAFDFPLKQKQQLQIFDVTGRLIYTQTINAGESKINVDVSGYVQGTYFVKINAAVKKIIKM